MMITIFRGVNFFLSNFFPCPVLYQGMVYPSSEHAYQAAKTHDPEQKTIIQQFKTPEEAKRYANTVAFKNRHMRLDWEGVKLGIMEEILREKFSNDALKQLLLNTDKQEIVETNWWGDRYWGVHLGQGENHLGKLLMKLRAEYKLDCDVPF